MINITAGISIDEAELDWQAIRASGPGGQHVNKTSTAIQLIFDIRQSSLPEEYKSALLQKADHRITASGKIVIKSQQSRSQEMNRETALMQLIELIKSAGFKPKKRHATKPTYGSQQRRLEGKKQRSVTKSLRQQKNKFD
ncbi:alternative ribosome rescue aminoacyl-tRNA hydrolase ArfB [Rheinheimera sp. 4Y26]|uniref:alternative ribosome rescue aminoacyl-tRNA hydrolase ArfB n=1 Tax=Rheinheimera sp. 4Y26 TaxID=2977811 RepID=UPI0021B0F2CD|nr:alternative ribosome rescue aminoacyl-tRNA hydrolase ArfB [Rheinheimera sp. 4Y26]MCT6699796.1 alternative ribosome rescue aminoacyl-tRNA hydrolase ArfB [Rheinheimera sp. 4Y26]